MGAFTLACVFGPMPVPQAIARCREMEAGSGGDHRTEGLALCARAQLEAMRGSFDEARALYARARTVLTDVGGSMLGASTALDSSMVEMLAGDHAAAERELRRDAELLEGMGERYLLSTMEGVRAQALIALGRHDEAAAACARAEAAAAADDIESQVLVRSVRAELHLHAGRTLEAAASAAAADALLRGAEAPTIVADLAIVRGRIAAAGGDLGRPTASSTARPGSTATRATSSPRPGSARCGRRSGSAPSPPDQARQRPFVDEFTSISTSNWPFLQCFGLTILRADTHGSGDATPAAPVQFGTETPSWNIASFFSDLAVKCFGSSLESSRKLRCSGSVTGNGFAAIVTTEIWPTQVAPGPHASCGLVASTSDREVAAPVCVAGTTAVVDCGFAALVVEPVLTVPPAGSTYTATLFGDGACTVTVV